MSDNCTKAKLKGGSLFDGIGGFPLAGKIFGIDFVWASEIEPFPISVTEKHFPDMKHLGDITKINGAEIEPVDVITFGSPCQDLSVAGKRAGLEGERSGLFMEAVRIIREMRLKTNGEYPKFAVWENVPGAFSSAKGNDFRAVLEEITESQIPMPSSGKWATAGMVRGCGREVAWRVLDAQYWGVPQRRKRIFLVADFRGHSASEILFIEKGLRGAITQSREQRQGTTRNSPDCPEKPSGCMTLANVASTLRAGAGAPKHEQDYVGRLVCQVNAFACKQRGEVRLIGENCTTLQAQPGREQQTFVCFEPRSQDGVPRIHDEICPTLNTAQGGQRQPCIAYGIAGNTIDRKIENGGTGKGVKEEVSYTLNTMDRHAVGYAQQRDYTVRRLTPTECERLQGLPDDWTVTEKGSDTARYKALGNGMAQPCVNFVIDGIARVLKEVR